MISASRHCEFIVASDFLELNRDKMALWVAGGSSGNGGINGSQDVQQQQQQQQVQQQEEDQLWLPFSRYVARLERLEYAPPLTSLLPFLKITQITFSFFLSCPYQLVNK